MSYAEILLVVQGGVDARERAEETGQLRRLLLAAGAESVRLAEQGGTPPSGTKSGDELALGALLVTLAPHVFTTVLGIVQAWTERANGRSVEMRIGDDSFQASGLDSAEQRALVEAFTEHVRSAGAAERTE